MRGNRVLASALIAALALGPSAARAQTDPTALLREAIQAPRNVSFVGQVQDVEFGQSKAEASIFRVEHAAPDATRRWYLAPQTLYGDSIVSRGDTSYEVDVKHDRIIVSTDDAIDDQVALDDNFGLLTKNYRAIMAPDDTVAGRRALVVLLVNKYTGQTVMRVWLDAQTKLVLEKERYAANGAVSHQMRFEQIRYVHALPSAIFALPSRGFARIEGPSHGTPSNDLAGAVRTAGFQALGPKYLPEGFFPVAATVTQIKGVRTLHVLYSDGIRTVSLFENARGAAVDLSRFTVHDARVGNHSAQYVETGPTMLLAWAQAGLHFALVGELARDELLKIASSIVP